MKFKCYYFFLCLLIFQTSFAQTWKDTLSLLDKAFSDYKPDNAGCQLSISRNGKIIFSKAWGMADLEHNVPLTTYSIFEAGSISKQFVAAAILLLDQQGKISLTDNVQKYIPELPDYKTPIKLSNLLHHTSGIRDWGDIVSLTGWARTQKFYTNRDVLEILAHQKQLNFKPGNEFLYSNSNYCLLALIVERVSGFSLSAFTEKYIFQPAGMTHTQWRDDPRRIVVNRAIAYSRSGGSYRTNMPNEYVYGPGGLLTTADDLLKWNNFYEGGNLGATSLLSKQIQTEPLNNGGANAYAAGLVINDVMGWKNISHDGATASYRAYLEMFPELHLSIALLSNTSEFGISDMESRIRKIFVQNKTAKKLEGNRHKTNTDNKESVKLPQAYLKSFEGMYVNERTYFKFNLSVKSDTLIFDNYLPLVPVSEKRFMSDNILFELKKGKGLFITLSPSDTILITKVNPANITKQNFAVYEGTYFSEETNSYLKIRNDSNKVLIRLNSNKEFQLIPVFENVFRLDELDCNVQFIRIAKKKVPVIKFYFSRTRGVEFKKVKTTYY